MAADAAPTQPPLPADFGFTFHPSLSGYNHPIPTFLALHDKHWDGICTSAVVFHPETDKVLLIQRARHDSGGLSWETPGGATDAEDPSILHGCVRELWEEAGLRGRFVRRIVSGFEEGDDAGEDLSGGLKGRVFTSWRRKLIFCFFTFVVDLKLEEMSEGIKLDPNEHEDYVWASEEEVEAGKVGDKDIPLTHEAQRALIREAYRLRRADAEKA